MRSDGGYKGPGHRKRRPATVRRVAPPPRRRAAPPVLRGAFPKVYGRPPQRKPVRRKPARRKVAPRRSAPAPRVQLPGLTGGPVFTNRERRKLRGGRPVPAGRGKVYVRDAGGRLQTLRTGEYRRRVAKSRRNLAGREREARFQGYRSAGAQSRANRARPGTRGGRPQVAGVTLGEFNRFLSRKTLVGAAAPAAYKLAKFPVEVPYQVARATVESPRKVAGGTARGVRDMIYGLPAAAVKSVTDPKGAAKDLLGDYGRRYGPLIEGDSKKFRERIKKEGAASEFLDISGVGAVGGSVAGKVGRAVGRGPTVKTRPKLRRSGGPATPQATSRNVGAAYAQHALDRTRARRSTKRQAVAKQGGRVPALDVSLKSGEVAPIRRGNLLGDRRVATRKSRAVQAMKAEQAREVHKGATRELSRLDKHERRAFKYAMQLGIRDPATGAKRLARHRQTIVANRKAAGTDIPRSLRKTNDELRHIDELLKDPAKAFTPRLAKVAEGERRRGNRVAKGDPGLATAQGLLRRYTPQAEHLGISRKQGESNSAFVKRVRTAAVKKGLARPAYFASRKRPDANFGSYAVGGSKAVQGEKYAYKGDLFRTGREDIRPQVHADALAKNIKRKHNWNTVADNFDANAFGWGKNKSISQLRDILDRKGIDPDSVAFWNPRKYREVRKNTEGSHDPAVHGEDLAPPGLDKAVDEAAVAADGLSTKGDDFLNTSGWSVIPKAVYDEIHADTRPSGKVARGWDVVKGKQSRILLGTNPPWLAFQVGSNVGLTALAKTGPFDLVKANLGWWKGLDPKLREGVEPFVGVGAHYVDVQQTKLGASANGQLVNAYRAFKQHPALQRLSKANPLDAMYRADDAQNSFFRKGVLYSQVKRDAYARIGQNLGGAAAMQARIHGLFTLGPKEQMSAVLRDRPALERHAGYVNDMLGDYLTYTAKERRLLGRSVMFYGFLRFSLKFAFHTMPVKHPVMTALIGNLGQLQVAEVRRLLGGDELPFALGKIYLTRDGELREVNLTRLNPASNQVVEALGNPRPLGKFISSLPPVVGTALDLAFEKTGFTGKPIKVEGEHNYAALDRQAQGRGLGAGNASRVAASRMLRLVFPYRVWEGVEYKDVPQGDDSFPFAPRPTKFKDSGRGAEIRRDIAKARRRQEAKGTGGILREELLPFLPKATRDPEFAQSIRERRGGKKAPSSGGGDWMDGYRSGGGSGGGPPKKTGSWMDGYR